MIRRLKKVTSQAELQQLIETGIIVSPYIAFDSSSNVTNMVLPAEREISEIEYEQETNLPIRLVSAIEPDYSTEEGFTVCSLDFTINAEQVAECDELFLLLCRKSYFDNALANSEVSKETLITTYLMDAYNGDDKTLDFSQAFAVNFRNFSFGEDVACKSDSYNLAQDDMMFVPYNNTYPNDNTYYLFAGYVYAGDFVSDLVYELAQYRVMPYLSNNAEFVQLGMHVAGTQRGNCVDIDIRVPGNTLYDRVKYGWYLGGYSSEDAIAADRIAVCDATTTFFMSDHNAPEYVNNTDQPLTGYVSVQLFNSVTGVTGAPTAFAMMTVQPSESGADSSIWWEDFNFDDEPAESDMIEHHEQTPGDEDAMSTLYTLPQDELGIINNALGGNRTLETAIIVNPTVTEDDGEFSISGGRAIIGDASGNFITFEDCSIGFVDDSYLVIKSIKNAPANGILSSPPAYTTVENYYSILHFGSQDLALLKIDIDGSNSNWINVNASRWSSNTPVHDASTAWYQNVNFDGGDLNYNDVVDTNAVEEEYSNFADAVSSLMLNDVFNNPEPGKTWTNNSVISLVIGGTYSTGYLSGGRQVPGTININAKTITFNNVSFTSDQMIYLVVDCCGTAPCDTPFESYTVISHTYSITRAVAGQNSGATCTITATLDEWDNINGFEFDYGNSGESGDDSSTGEDPTLAFSSTDLTYNTVADFVPVISGDDSYYDSVAFFVIPDSMIADTLSDNPDWTMADAVWSLVENEDTRSVGLDSSSGDTVDLSGILNTYYDNQEVYVVALLEHYEVGEYPVYYQPDDEAGNYAYETFAWGEPAEPEPEEPEEEPEE